MRPLPHWKRRWQQLEPFANQQHRTGLGGIVQIPNCSPMPFAQLVSDSFHVQMHVGGVERRSFQIFVAAAVAKFGKKFGCESKSRKLNLLTNLCVSVQHPLRSDAVNTNQNLVMFVHRHAKQQVTQPFFFFFFFFLKKKL